jgi:pyrroloquinoline quinone (PQQ) biosynthesis protein C
MTAELWKSNEALKNESPGHLVALHHGMLAAPLSSPDGSDASLSALAKQALCHRAVQHPYLEALARGDLPDLRWALADFARHYAFYSRQFPQFLTAVISRLDDPAHRRLLLDNLSEESGQYGEEELRELAAIGVEAEWIVGVPHPQLFQRFARAVGVEPGHGVEADVVRCWREMFMATLQHGSPAQAVGALGLGTEQIVRTVYGSFVRALARVPGLAPRDTVFFLLHTAVDDHHQESLQRIARDLVAQPGGMDELRRGMVKALQLRTALWDWLHARAVDPVHADEVH